MIGWVRVLLRATDGLKRQKLQRVIEYIDECLKHADTIVLSDGKSRERMELARKFLQHAHQEIFHVLDGVASLVADYEERLFAYTKHVYPQKLFRQNSNERFVKEFLKGEQPADREEETRRLEKIKDVCIEDIQRVAHLKEILKSRKLRYIT
ncbi:MAG: hypothetical protein H6981_07570 [Gammaproteobacteria bacterium]|nr:hypothetical protein [Gammaproteobacteria bacterium]MCP5136642.1 hypothetical protein [Gammaproteobacteria bacterium]